jgi:hypothetical protein
VRLPKGKYSTYIPMTFAYTGKGNGIFFNTTYRTDWNLKNKKKAYVTIETVKI